MFLVEVSICDVSLMIAAKSNVELWQICGSEIDGKELGHIGMQNVSDVLEFFQKASQ